MKKQQPEVFYKEILFLKVSENWKERMCQNLFLKKVPGLKLQHEK